jgi:hypothetical protein
MGYCAGEYRVTMRRPVGGIMRAKGAVVPLSAREADTEMPWGGLELVAAGESQGGQIEDGSAAPGQSSTAETSGEERPATAARKRKAT